MRVLIPLLVYLAGCVSLTVGMFLWTIAAGFITAGVLAIATAFVWPYIEVPVASREMTGEYRAVA